MEKLESGTYSRYRTPTGLVLEVFEVHEVGVNESNPLQLRKHYYRPGVEDDEEPGGPFDTEEAALAAAY